MRIGVFLDHQITDGGGYQQSVNAVDQLSRQLNSEDELVIINTRATNRGNQITKKYKTINISVSTLDKIVVGFLIDYGTGFLGKFLSRIGLRTRLEKIIKYNKIDIIYFLSPSPFAAVLCNTSYIFTVWDICHIDNVEFPEVSGFGEYNYREIIYNKSIPRSMLTVTDSNEVAERIRNKYQLKSERVLVMPFMAGGCVGDIVSERPKILRYEIKSFFFYPAQFWPHKNHICILDAIKILKQEGVVCNVVFCGSEKGNKEYISEEIIRLGIVEQVQILGFVTDEELRWLYTNAVGMIMPSYFGPTNIPPIESWHFGTPVIYSRVMNEQVGLGGIAINPEDPMDLAKAIKSIFTSPELSAQLVEAGGKRIKELTEMRDLSELKLKNMISKYRVRRRCWRQ